MTADSTFLRHYLPLGFPSKRATAQDPPQTGKNWSRVRDGAISFPPARGRKGPRSLLAMGLRVLADNIGAADKDMMRCLPDKVLEALWRELAPR